MPGLDSAQAMKDSADARVATRPKKQCSLGFGLEKMVTKIFNNLNANVKTGAMINLVKVSWCLLKNGWMKMDERASLTPLSYYRNLWQKRHIENAATVAVPLTARVFFLVAFFWFGWCVKTEARTRCPWCYCTSVVRWPCTKANTSQHTMLNEMDILAKLRSERETNRQNHLFSLEPDGEMTNHPTSYNSQAWCFMIIDNIPLHFLLPGNS